MLNPLKSLYQANSIGFLSKALAVLGVIAVSIGDAQAQDGLDTGDTAWMLTSSALVLLMTLPGLALFYGGLVRKKNVLAMTAQIFTIAAAASVIWMIVGYSLAFSEGNAFVGDLSNMFLANVALESMSGSIPESLFVMFQMTFAIITPALIVGAFADRMKFSSSIIFSSLWLIVVYAPICHWVWGGGFLANDGVLDFAGGTVVHINAGVAGLVAALYLKPRHNYGKENMAPHNLVLSTIGASLLWVGWFGFNAGSAVSAGASASMAMLVTQLATAGGVLSWLFAEWLFRKKPSLLGALSGAIGGLVAITPAAGFVGPIDAFILGVISGLVCYWSVAWLKQKLRYDDSLDVFGIHGVAGIVGAVLTGVFAREAIGGAPGLLEGNAGQVWTQTYGILATIAYCAVATAVLLFITGLLTKGLRVSQEAEVEGLDINQHGEVIQ